MRLLEKLPNFLASSHKIAKIEPDQKQILCICHTHTHTHIPPPLSSASCEKSIEVCMSNNHLLNPLL